MDEELDYWWVFGKAENETECWTVDADTLREAMKLAEKEGITTEPLELWHGTNLVWGFEGDTLANLPEQFRGD